MKQLKQILNTLLYLPLFLLAIKDKKVKAELHNACDAMGHPKGWYRLVHLLKNHREYRNLLYYRLYSDKFSLCQLLYKPEQTFYIWAESLGQDVVLWHPFSTIVNCKQMGRGCVIRNNTTIGNKGLLLSGTPIIGNNVNIGANVCIIGGISIGDNVTIGAGSVVVKDVPSNAKIAGNPACIIGYKDGNFVNGDINNNTSL